MGSGCVGSIVTNGLDRSLSTVTSFEECSDAGYAIMESYPEQCSDGKNTFVAEIKENIAICEDTCGDGICAEIVCQGEGCPCAETPTSCAADCGVEDTLDTVITNDSSIINNDMSLLEKYTGAILKTSKGNITVSFYGDDSPKTVENFLTLAESGFYNGTSFHRVIESFMVQGGDPNSKDQSSRHTHGTGGPGYAFADEFNAHKLVKGSLAMANSGPNTNGSQFFIVTAEETPWLDGRHTNFGEVTDGLDIVLAIEGVEKDGRDNPTEPITIDSIELL